MKWNGLMDNDNATRFLRKSYSQVGEDGVIEWYFTGRHPGFYVDVGAHHPYRFSNTALLHDAFGWKGINIDVDQRAIDEFQRYRPNDVNICSGVADQNGSLEVTIFTEEGAVNSFDKEFASASAWAHFEKTTKMVEVRRLDSILEEHVPKGAKIDFLNIDVEKFDLKVLRSNDWYVYRPELISVETNIPDMSQLAADPIYAFLTERNYSMMSQVCGTSFFQRKSVNG